MDTLKVTIEQGDANGLLSRTTVEWFQLPNAEANVANLGLTEAITAEVRRWAAQKAQGPVTVTPGRK
jgi:hypothetical protein